MAVPKRGARKIEMVNGREVDRGCGASGRSPVTAVKRRVNVLAKRGQPTDLCAAIYWSRMRTVRRPVPTRLCNPANTTSDQEKQSRAMAPVLGYAEHVTPMGSTAADEGDVFHRQICLRGATKLCEVFRRVRSLRSSLRELRWYPSGCHGEYRRASW